MSETTPADSAPAPEEHKNILQKSKDGIAHAGHVIGDGLHKAVDATILDKSPHGTNVDGFVEPHGVAARENARHEQIQKDQEAMKH